MSASDAKARRSVLGSFPLPVCEKCSINTQMEASWLSSSKKQRHGISLSCRKRHKKYYCKTQLVNARPPTVPGTALWITPCPLLSAGDASQSTASIVAAKHMQGNVPRSASFQVSQAMHFTKMKKGCGPTVSVAIEQFSEILAKDGVLEWSATLNSVKDGSRNAKYARMSCLSAPTSARSIGQQNIQWRRRENCFWENLPKYLSKYAQCTSASVVGFMARCAIGYTYSEFESTSSPRHKCTNMYEY